MSTLGSLEIIGKVTQSQAATDPTDLVRLGEAQALLATQLAGAWAVGTAYTAGQMVTYNTAFWVCLTANTGQAPGSGAYWGELLRAVTGATGASGTGGSAGAQGIQGATGPTGPAGVAGATGPAGVVSVAVGTTVGGPLGFVSGTGVLTISASSANTASFLVQRDAAGDFHAGTAGLTAVALTGGGVATLSASAGALVSDKSLTVPGLTVTSLAGGVLRATSGSGVVVGSATTTDLPEGSAGASPYQYFTAARVLAAPVTGYSEVVPGAVAVSAADPLITALSKIGARSAGGAAYVYVGYAADANGAAYSATPSPSLNFIAVLPSTTPITVLTGSSFAGLWKQYSLGVTGVTAPLTITSGTGVLGANASSANTAGNLVQRDGSGNFSARTGSFTGLNLGASGEAAVTYSSSALQISTPVKVAGLTVGTVAGALKATAGVVSGAATTADVPEGAVVEPGEVISGRPYFSNARVRATVMGSGSGTGPTAIASDTLPAAIHKLDVLLGAGGVAAALPLVGGTLSGDLKFSNTALLKLTKVAGDGPLGTDVSLYGGMFYDTTAHQIKAIVQTASDDTAVKFCVVAAVPATAITNVASGGGASATGNATAINSILAALRTHGIVAV